MRKSKLELEKTTVELLEKTKKFVKYYSEERKKLFNFYDGKDTNLDEWENYILLVENKISTDKDIQ